MKNIFNKIILFTICLIFFSCNRTFYPGEYSYSVANASYEVFKLNRDSTFEYIYRSGWNKSNSIGRWSIKGKAVILNSQYKKNALPITVNATYNGNQNEYLFHFKKYFPKKDNPNLWQKLILNDKDTFIVQDSIMKIKYFKELKTFKVEIITTEYLNDSVGMFKLMTENYIAPSKKENEFILNYPFDWNMSYYRNFNNEKLLIKYQGLYWSAKRQKYKRS
jgi:hypothetical protein